MSTSVIEELHMETVNLAHDMVRLEGWARDAYLRRNFVRVGELNTEREVVQQYRSYLLRELWMSQGRRRAREALRYA